MPDGKDMLNDMEFNKQLEQMGNDLPSLVKFVAWRQYDMAKELSKITALCPIHSDKIRRLEVRSKKEMGASSGIGATIGAAIVVIIDFFMHR